MTAERVLFLGVTGVDKSQALQRLAKWCHDHHGQNWEVVNFEKQYLWPGRGSEHQRGSFLDNPLREQHKQWHEAWQRFTADYPPSDRSRNVFLGLHGSFIRGHYGVRSPISTESIGKDFAPDLVFTLITDLYDMWWLTEARAQGDSFRGRPTLEDLLLARRIELIMGDRIARESGASIRNLMLSVSHPCETFAHAVAHPQEHQVVYLSFPISQPRELEAKGDREPRRRVSEFIRRAYACQATNPHLVLQCPLGIDEVPFARILPSSTPQSAITEAVVRYPSGRVISFDRDSLRWDLSEFWEVADRLVPPVTPQGGFEESALRTASGSIMTDVTWRDYRLVDQADFVLVFNPIFNNRDHMAGSVELEVEHAQAQKNRVFLFQDPQHDMEDRVGKQLGVERQGHRPTMAPNPTRNLLSRKDSLEGLLEVLRP